MCESPGVFRGGWSGLELTDTLTLPDVSLLLPTTSSNGVLGGVGGVGLGDSVDPLCSNNFKLGRVLDILF